MAFDLVLKPSCSRCGFEKDLYGSNCKHLTLCMDCGKAMAENRSTCRDCGAIITRLIREYNVRASSSSDKNYFIGSFVTGLPNFSKKDSDTKWSLQKVGLEGRQVTDALRDKFKHKPWLLEDETGQYQYQGHNEGAQSTTYYLLMLQGKEFVALPAGSWYNFNKIAQYKQLTLEEAEEKMKNRRKTADGYERWMMKAANNGPSAFGEVEKLDDKDGGMTGGNVHRKTNFDDDAEGNASDIGEEDEEEEGARKSRLNLNKKSGDDDDEEGPGGGELDDDDDIEKGDDWEHEEIFTDDDEATGNDPEEREDLDPEVPAPPEIKDEEDENEEDGGLSKSGKELKKLLKQTGGLSESDAENDTEDEDDDDEDMDAPKEEPVDSSPTKPVPAGSARGTPSNSKSGNGKRKSIGDDTKALNSVPPKKIKAETETKLSAKDESPGKGMVHPKGTPSSSKTGSTSSVGPVTEEEIRAVLVQKAPITTSELVSNFKGRLKCREDKTAFADIVKRISKIQKTSGGPGYVVLRER